MQHKSEFPLALQRLFLERKCQMCLLVKRTGLDGSAEEKPSDYGRYGKLFGGIQQKNACLIAQPPVPLDTLTEKVIIDFIVVPTTKWDRFGMR